MNPNTMTLDECIKWLRDRLYVKCKCDTDCGEAWFRRSDGGYVCNSTHDPIPPILDALDKARPRGWSFSIRLDFDGQWVAVGNRREGTILGWRFTGTGEIKALDRLTCEARLVVEMLMAELLDKLPVYSPGWNPDVRAAWLVAFDRVLALVEKLHRRNIIPDTTGAERP